MNKVPNDTTVIFDEGYSEWTSVRGLRDGKVGYFHIDNGNVHYKLHDRNQFKYDDHKNEILSIRYQTVIDMNDDF